MASGLHEDSTLQIPMKMSMKMQEEHSHTIKKTKIGRTLIVVAKFKTDGSQGEKNKKKRQLVPYPCFTRKIKQFHLPERFF